MDNSPKSPTDGPRGVKRKATDDEALITAPRRIVALAQDVVNKIAAGEIIVAPMHALKEMIENSVDAGSTLIEILVKDGGLKLLQITDNGHGIQKDDLPILCERFTTSKLKSFEDLTSIATYGFRGEALASISHIAHLRVTTKIKSSNCAYQAHYDGGLLIPAKPGQSAEPRPIAGRDGTQITVEDLFYNVPTRRRAFRSAAEEYNKIIDVVSRYAIHTPGVAFSCKKHGETGTSIATQASSSVLDRVRQIYGGAVANELVEVSMADAGLGFDARGWTTNANYHVKKTVLLLFINNRLVESTNIRKSIEQTYAHFLPKGGHPFTYLSLSIDPARIDVNVHPTKREVNILNEDAIVALICTTIRLQLAAVDTSRTFATQTLLPGARAPEPSAVTEEPGGSTATQARPKPHESNLVRTDAKLRKITSMLEPAAADHAESVDVNIPDSANGIGSDIIYTTTDRVPTTCRLQTVRELRAEVRDAMHENLTEIMASHTFVGIVSHTRRLAAIQSGVKLFVVDYGLLSAEFFYQIGLTDFGNFGRLRFATPLDLRELLLMAARCEKDALSADAPPGDDFDVAELAELVRAQLMERREMLSEYFALDIGADGRLETLPLLLRGYTPSLAKMPRFLLRLGPKVDWRTERECFDSFLRELAAWYAVEVLPEEAATEAVPGEQAATTQPDVNMLDDTDEPAAPTQTSGDTEPADSTHLPNTSEHVELKARRAHVSKCIEHVLFPAFRARLLVTKAFTKGAVLEVANLKGLYRVFERC